MRHAPLAVNDLSGQADRRMQQCNDMAQPLRPLRLLSLELLVLDNRIL